MGRLMVKRQTNRLTAITVNSKKVQGFYLDGNGLYLQVSASGSKSWILRFMLAGRTRDMGLGSTSDWTLSEVREQARKYRQLLAEGIDPIEHRNIERAKNLLRTAQRRTFEECAVEYQKLHATGWKNVKHASQWTNTLATYAYPYFGSVDVSEVTKAHILNALEPIWLIKPDTASRVRQRVRAVLDWSAAKDYRRGHDPHIWDQITRALPKTKDIRKVKHHAACPYAEVRDLLNTIKMSGAGDTVKRAFEFTVLTAARSGEMRLATWSEIDFKTKRWNIPAERMKSAKEHRVPLSPRVLEILEEQRGNGSDLIFASDRGKVYSDMTFTMLMRRLGLPFTVHGFRSTFRDWSAEQTSYPRDVCEAALAHTNKDATEAAYFRSDLFEKRREMMNDWADYCGVKQAAPKIKN